MGVEQRRGGGDGGGDDDNDDVLELQVNWCLMRAAIRGPTIYPHVSMSTMHTCDGADTGAQAAQAAQDGIFTLKSQ